MAFLFSLPLWLLAVVLNAWLMGVALIGVWVVRRCLLPRLRLGGDDALFFGAAALQSALVLYGLVAALTAFSVWGRHEQVSGVVSREATALAGLWRNLGGYPQPARDAMQECCAATRTKSSTAPGPPSSRGSSRVKAWTY
jgi:ABC-type uncharacterized transport system permease subunit